MPFFLSCLYRARPSTDFCSALLLILLLLIQGCAPIDTQAASAGTYQVADEGELPISYQVAGTQGKPLVVFIHGTPGSSQAFQHLLSQPQLQACCHLIAVDRLGFGKSASSDVQPDFDVQTAAIVEVFKQNESDSPILLVGHSLGGSIGAQVAIDNPNTVGALLIISSALDPKLSGPRWYQRLADLPIIKHIIPEDLHRANEEMLQLKPSLEAIAGGWEHLEIPVTIIQGEKDGLVPQQNPQFAKQKMPASLLRVHMFPQDGHFILWERPEFIVEQVLLLVQAMNGKAQEVNDAS